MSIPAALLVHTATVKPYAGSGAYGDVYGAPFDLPCYFERKRQLVRDSDGDEAVSEATIYADLGTEVPPGSLVTVDGYESTVLTVAVLDDKGLTGLAHQEVSLR